jgi:hypothetical protein
MTHLLTLLSLIACHETPEFEPVEGDVPAKLWNSYISIPNSDVSYSTSDEYFPINYGQSNNYYIPGQTGWNYEDLFHNDDAGMALYFPEDIYFNLEPIITDTPDLYDSPRFHITSQEFTAILIRRNCEIQIPMQITTETLASKNQSCGTQPLSDTIHNGYFDADSLLLSIGEYLETSGCTGIEIIPEDVEANDVCIGFAVESPDLFSLAVEAYPVYASLWD